MKKIFLLLLLIPFFVSGQLPTTAAVTYTNNNVDTKYPAALDAVTDFWINGRTTDGKTATGYQNSVVTGNIVTNNLTPLTFTPITTGAQYVRFSGDWFYGIGNQGIENTSKTGRRFLHDGTNWEIWYRIYFVPVSTAVPSYGITVLSNNNATSTNRGINISYSVSASNQVSMNFNVTNGGGSAVINTNLTNFLSSAVGSFYTFRITKTGSGTGVGNATYTIYMDGQSKFSGTNTGAITGTADATDNLTMFKMSTTNTYSQNFLLKQFLVLKNYTVNSTERDNLYKYFSQGSEIPGTGRRLIYAIKIDGQSNISGSTWPNNPPSGIRGPSNQSWILPPSNGPTFALADVIAQLEYGVNQNTAPEDLTMFGPSLELGYRMQQVKPDQTVIIQYSKSATYFYNDASAQTWNTLYASSLTRNSHNLQWVNFLTKAKYQLNARIDPTYIQEIGNTDGQGTNPNAPSNVRSGYKTDCTNKLKDFIDVTRAQGYTRYPVKFLIHKIYTSAPGTYIADVNLAIGDMAAFRTDNPTYSTYCLDPVILSTDGVAYGADATHRTSQGQVDIGDLDFNTLFPLLIKN